MTRQYQTVSRWLSGALLLLAVAVQALVLLTTSYINRDEMLQLGVGQSIVQGQNQTLLTAAVADLSKTVSVPSLRMPPFYATAHALARTWIDNPNAVDYMLDLVFSVVFFISWLVIIRGLRPAISPLFEPGFMVAMVIWPAALLVCLGTGHTSNLVVTALFAMLVAVLVAGSRNTVDGRRGAGLVLFFAAGLVAGGAAVVHYTAWPLILVLPCTVLVNAWCSHGQYRHWISPLIAGATGTAVIFAPMVLNNLALTGHISRASNVARGWFPHHLQLTVPFPAYSLGIEGRGLTETPRSLEFALPELLSLVLVIVFVIACVALLRKFVPGVTYKTPTEEVASRTFVTATVSGLVLGFSSLALLSVTSGLYRVHGGWTYVAEVRYFAPFLTLFVVGITVLWSLHHARLRGRTAGNLVGAFCGMLLLVFFASVVPERWAQIATASHAAENYSFPRIPEIDALRQLARDTPQKDVVLLLTPEHNLLRNFVFAAGIPVLAVRPDTLIRTSEEISVLMYFRSEADDAAWKARVLGRADVAKQLTEGKKLRIRGGWLQQYVLQPQT